MKNKGFVGKCKTASGEEAQNLKHEIRKEEVSGQWSIVIGEDEEDAASLRQGPLSRKVRLSELSYREEEEGNKPRMNANRREWGE
jgi:hypothetical protein